MMKIFEDISFHCSRYTTQRYSTSFSSAIRLLHRDLRQPIYNLYGFVRFADEIVDTFLDYDRKILLEEFKAETYRAIERKISLNPVLQSFQQTVHQYELDPELIGAFFRSMECDLYKSAYEKEDYETYIYGSAEVVGLMCLQIFCEKDHEVYIRLKPYAQSLGAAFQKINFLRDVKADFQQLDRVYFPGVDFHHFTMEHKQKIEEEIKLDFTKAYEGIRQLPFKSRFGVYVAYKYYHSLFNKIREIQAERILEERIRIPNYSKALIYLSAGVKNRLKLI